MVIINKKVFSLIIAVIFFMTLFFLLNQKTVLTPNKIVENIHFIKIGGKTLKVEFAITPEEKARGLSGRNELKEDESMLFIFDNSDKYSFWMKDMNFDIDIIWIDEEKNVVFVADNVSPLSFPQSFAPPASSLYVLEVLDTFSEKYNLKIGDKVEFLSP